MIYKRLLDMIEKNADTLARQLCRDILERDQTKGYRRIPEDKLYERIFDVYSNLDSWLKTDKHTEGEVKRVYTELGRTRFREGIPLYEVILAFMLIKRHLWLFVQRESLFNSTVELHQALELNNKVVYFFDRAIYFVSMGYEQEGCRGKG